MMVQTIDGEEAAAASMVETELAIQIREKYGST